MQHNQLREIRKQKQLAFQKYQLKDIKTHYTKLKGLNSQLMALHLQPYQKQSDLTEALKSPNSRGLIVKLIELEKNLISLNAEFHSELRSLYEKITAFCPPVKEPATTVINHHFNALISSVSEYPFGGSDSERFEAYAPMISLTRKFEEVFNRFLGRLISDDILFAEQNAYESNLESQKEVQNHVDLQGLGLGDFAHCSIEIMLHILSNLDIQDQAHCCLLNHAFYTLIEQEMFGRLTFFELNRKIGNITVIEWLIQNGYQTLVDYIFTHTIIKIFDEDGRVKQSFQDQDQQEIRKINTSKFDFHAMTWIDVIWAAKCNQHDFLQQNKEKVCRSLRTNNNGQGGLSVIDYALQYGQLDRIEELLKLLPPNSSLESFWVDNSYTGTQSPLNWAASKKNLDFALSLLRFLMENRSSSLFGKSCYGFSDFKFFHIAAGKGFLDFLKGITKLLKKSDTANKWVSELLSQTTKNRTPFVWAIQFSQTKVLKYLFKHYPVSGSQSVSSVIRNAKHLASGSPIPYDAEIFPAEHKEAVASLSYLEIIQTLIEFGADINMPDSDGKTPLKLALEEKNLEAVNFLLKNGANVNETDSNGNPLLHTFMKMHSDNAYHFTHFDTNTFSALLTLLIEFKVNVNAIDRKGKTILHDLAVLNPVSGDFSGGVEKFRETAVQILLPAGASVTLKDCNGNTPIDVAKSCQKSLRDHKQDQAKFLAWLSIIKSPNVYGFFQPGEEGEKEAGYTLMPRLI